MTSSLPWSTWLSQSCAKFQWAGNPSRGAELEQPKYFSATELHTEVLSTAAPEQLMIKDLLLLLLRKDSLSQALTELKASKEEGKTAYQQGYNPRVDATTENYKAQMPGIQDEIWAAV
ncbi:hypothetical protein RHSIM_Rhsim04G0130900 [Rhododendron simsii]|uniref:Uncharacterized protein n=1 Tax=Rhododendron simsii TaxID=118357 RepID=A0A834LN37_RHOSS|nr:hypothetical protein RHSIM_Rhsim04G0130900 [Rhododendron simsii]